MNDSIAIDTSFDFRSDTPPNKDPDTWSPTLVRYHRQLWSKPLPDGSILHLEHGGTPFYLMHHSRLGEFLFSSDTVVPTFWWQKNIDELADPTDVSSFRTTAFTIGGMMIFPANQIEGKWTINQARGCTRKISDRFDLTVECIRRHYDGGGSPLGAVLDRYADFLALFGGFRGFVEFFLLQDLVSRGFQKVRFFLPFDDFTSPAVPQTKDEYGEYRTRAMGFIDSRNQRILEWANIHLGSNR